jgi:hypothetical protein
LITFHAFPNLAPNGVQIKGNSFYYAGKKNQRVDRLRKQRPEVGSRSKRSGRNQSSSKQNLRKLTQE